MTNYQKGAKHERDFQSRMEKLNYIAVRSAGSHSKADIILIPLENAQPIPEIGIGVFVCQLKRRKGKETKKEREEKEKFAKIRFYHPIVRKLWVSRKDREKEKVEEI